jgi:hypothetical protein
LVLWLIVTSCAGQQSPAARSGQQVQARSLAAPAQAADAKPPEEPVPRDTYLAVPQLLQFVNQARAARGLDPVRLDRVLCAVAQRGARSFFQHGGRGAEQRTALGISQELNRFHAVYRRVTTAVLAVPAIEAAAPEAVQPVLDPTMLYAGIAVEHQRNDLAIVLIFGQ